MTTTPDLLVLYAPHANRISVIEDGQEVLPSGVDVRTVLAYDPPEVPIEPFRARSTPRLTLPPTPRFAVGWDFVPEPGASAYTMASDVRGLFLDAMRAVGIEASRAHAAMDRLAAGLRKELS
jgi:hypothetical protein